MSLLELSQLCARHQPSGLNTTFGDATLSFDKYLLATQRMLSQAHTKLGTENAVAVVSGNMPFLREPARCDGAQHPYKRGILLTHGLTDSPYFMRHLADFFVSQGYLVMAILLPGHGTQPGDLLEVTWQEWAKAVAYGADRLAEQVDEVYLGGFSTGATLSIHQSQHDARVRGLFLYSPALKITPRAAYAKLHKLYSCLLPKTKWVSIQPDIDCYKYESFTMNGAAQMYALTQRVAAAELTLQIPVFAAASEDDVTVDTLATIDLMSRARHPASHLLIYSTTPEISATKHPDAHITWLYSVFPEHRIIGSSHLSIVLPAYDEYYGVQGNYVNCNHYYPHELDKYIACRTHPREVVFGEISAANLQTGLIQRLMYNPGYEQLCSAMQYFITSLAAY